MYALGLQFQCMIQDTIHLKRIFKKIYHVSHVCSVLVYLLPVSFVPVFPPLFTFLGY